MKYIISVEGNIGSGKSTLLTYLKNTYDTLDGYQIIYLQEPVDSWNTITDSDGTTIIEKFYGDQKKYAFAFQMMAYITRLTQVKRAIEQAPEGSIIITERCLFTDKNIFAKMLYDSGIMSHIEYTIYLKWFDEFTSYTKLAGLIYIETTPEVCLERVAKRSRSGEDLIPLSYLESCHNYHEDWLKGDSNLSSLTLNGCDSIDYESIIRYIRSLLDTHLPNHNIHDMNRHSC